MTNSTGDRFLKYLKFLIWTLVGLILILFAISNNQTIEIRILPDSFGSSSGLKSYYSLPLFVILYAALVFGLSLGFFFEYFRERKHRVKLMQVNKDLKLLRSEMKNLKSNNLDGDSEILNLIDRD